MRKKFACGLVLGVVCSVGAGIAIGAGPLDPPTGTVSSTSPSLADILAAVSSPKTESWSVATDVVTDTSGPKTITITGPGTVNLIRMIDRDLDSSGATHAEMDIIIDGVVIFNGLDSPQVDKQPFSDQLVNDDGRIDQLFPLNFHFDTSFVVKFDQPSNATLTDVTRIIVSYCLD